ncbi:uncharacterized protein [Halyomorpha halys]|uniref:uncharacterized protein n=1 Tax=Halyomorpha halys TaxID=286706 RepID=UPI0006D52260|nr:uncharacterized protein LOC106692422 [Halyomorpha halys]
MEPLDRFLICVIKDMKSQGFLETLGRNIEYIIREGFKIVADLAVAFIKNLIRKFGLSSSTSHSNVIPNKTDNPILNIIITLINQFCPSNIAIKISYFKVALDLLIKLLSKRGYKKPECIVMREITQNEEKQTISFNKLPTPIVNTKHRVDVLPSRPMTETLLVTRAKLEADGKPLTETRNTHQNKSVGNIVGTKKANNTTFKSAERKISYYVGNVCTTTSEQNILDYLTTIIPAGIFECIKLKSNGKFQSFKLTTNFSSKKGLENPSIWPEGVRVRPWVRKNKIPSRSIHNAQTGIEAQRYGQAA